MSSLIEARVVLFVLCAAICAPSLPAASLQATAATEHVVTIENMQFTPSSLKVREGDRVRWVNKDFFPHTATARNNDFDSKVINSQSEWTWVAGKPGEYPYICTLHPSMQAALTVVVNTSS